MQVQRQCVLRAAYFSEIDEVVGTYDRQQISARNRGRPGMTSGKIGRQGPNFLRRNRLHLLWVGVSGQRSAHCEAECEDVEMMRFQ
jgi:hypothetical protein